MTQGIVRNAHILLAVTMVCACYAPFNTREGLPVNTLTAREQQEGWRLLSDGRTGSPEWTQRVASSKFAAMPLDGKAAEGHIGLQDHGDRVEFRNIRVKILP